MADVTWKDLYPQVADRIGEEEFRRIYSVQKMIAATASDLRTARRIQKITQVELARRAGTSQSAITRFENGYLNNVTLGFVARYLYALWGNGSQITLTLDNPLK